LGPVGVPIAERSARIWKSSHARVRGDGAGEQQAGKNENTFHVRNSCVVARSDQMLESIVALACAGIK
jgi:hypothetical protein